ncbi:hypothetical protein [Arthrobacter bambusae]|uniref:Uncharacterized protein n=1 Tax=Arthrobacter bambusae TaxID=1338426 RepID=A0AAW8DCL5_9MICC|nr:hypothetical protein [Arthrobacter bambusae]MDP9903166.1 hypothetical protein [Arthrobacter bambusae]MDQ0128840.1 hypothetical protein [Arthrobacter bambusae]MDQ0180181.1 hypothetical protein [Arthrobacter bambusae]
MSIRLPGVLSFADTSTVEIEPSLKDLRAKSWWFGLLRRLDVAGPDVTKSRGDTGNPVERFGAKGAGGDQLYDSHERISAEGRGGSSFLPRVADENDSC